MKQITDNAGFHGNVFNFVDRIVEDMNSQFARYADNELVRNENALAVWITEKIKYR